MSSHEESQSKTEEVDSFEAEAEKESVGIFRELYDFLRFNKKWWLAPIILVLIFLGVLMALSGTAAGPALYSLF